MGMSNRMYTVPGRFLKYFLEVSRVSLLLVNFGKFKGNPLENCIFILAPSALRNLFKIVCYFTASLPASFRGLLLPLRQLLLHSAPHSSFALLRNSHWLYPKQ